MTNDERIMRDGTMTECKHCDHKLQEAADSLERLQARNQKLEVALSFYGDPTVYHAVGFSFDRPCGAFEDDFSDTEVYDYPKPGKLARQILGFEPEFDPETFTALGSDDD